jgi:hypothetical protein
LNRKKCIRPNVCGTCLLGFTEPNSFKKSDSCINLPNKNNINLSITAQWETGFCGQWIITCPLNREIFFIIPEQLRDIRGWNMINMQKINNKIVGSCAEWVITGNTAIGGFCASFDYGKSVTINNDGYFFQNNILRRNLLDNQNILDTTYRNVSITMNIESNNLNYENVINNFKNNLYGTSDIIILNNQDSELSLKIDCKNRQDFDSALFLHVDMIDNIPVNYDLFYKEPINNENELKNSSNKINYPFYFILIILAIFIV